MNDYLSFYIIVFQYAFISWLYLLLIDIAESATQFIPVQTDVPIPDNNSNLEQGKLFNDIM